MALKLMRVKQNMLTNQFGKKCFSLFIISLLSVCFVYASTIMVCESCEVSTVIRAVHMAQPHDTVRVKSGEYEAISLEITKPITLLGEPGATLNGGANNYVLKLLADSITVSGFSILNSGRSYTKDYAAIYVYRASYVKIINNKISKAFFGILIEKSNNGVVSGNEVIGTAKKESQSGNGIHLWHCDGMRITENVVTGMRDGIYLEFVDNSQVNNNYTHHNVRYGLHFMFSNHDSYTDNKFEQNGAGVAVMFSKWIVMKRNNFYKNWGTASYGLLLKEIYDGEVEGNKFEENTIGIYIDGLTRMTFTRNTLRQNGWGVKVSGGCYTNEFKENNFIGNSFDLSYNSQLNDNTFNNNFWSDYTGYDLDKDGKGDVPYRPVKLFSYIVNQTPETIILLRSLFVDIINFSEKVSPVFTPDKLVDATPSIRTFQ
ncbi:MAG: nitrous oxide reductase family maturation protein NosD [Fulvivirga sp.]